MGALKGIKSLFAFFTVIPIKSDESTLTEAANYMPLAPLIGAVIGLLAGIVLGVFRLIFPTMIAGILAFGFLLYITGLHHTDGLIDFGDGLMYNGSPKEKIAAMHDKNTGVGGFALGFVILAATALSIPYLGALTFLQDLIVVEISAKFAMVTLAWIGKSAAPGMNVSFIEKMRGDKRGVRLASSLTISIVLAILITGLTGILIVLVGFLTTIFLTWVSNRNFGGITGDVFGATNDISRLTSLLAILAISR
ncbi:MAG: adenosylcobinamide-GDP ribazoletransferase [Thaumarchaeota archaeon]|nr:adenosylcobinamide-GDP ribazoletransferase [Nitrososphaerota archaeon]